MERILLIDADVVAYEAAAKVEVATEFEPGYWTWHCDEQAVRDRVDEKIADIMEALGGDACRLCLTDSEENFRLRVLPSYKGNRKSVKKPLVLKAIKQWLIDEREAVWRPNLEGDDVMGILATWPGLKGEKVIVSIDKDMKTIPGLYYRDRDTGIVEIDEGTADRWHLYQTLIGDTTDGYTGCPSIGPKKADAILEPFGEGPSFDRDAAWARIVEVYESKGLTAADALQQARVARILRASDYDFKNKRPILWTP